MMAREAILKRLTEMDLYRGTADNAMQLPICSRSGDIVEPRLKPQWFVNTESMAARALKSVVDGELKLIPEEHNQVSIYQKKKIHEHNFCYFYYFLFFFVHPLFL